MAFLKSLHQFSRSTEKAPLHFIYSNIILYLIYDSSSKTNESWRGEQRQGHLFELKVQGDMQQLNFSKKEKKCFKKNVQIMSEF